MKLPDLVRWAVLSPWLDELHNQPEAVRTARLGELRGRDAALADELQAWLSDSDQARSRGFLTGSATVPNPDKLLSAGLAGQRLGAYVLEAPLGQGGTGSVWRARRADGRFDTAVAIKLLHLSLLGRAGAERFQREGQLLARLTHPHIAHLLDAGVAPGGQPYLVIELVPGLRLDQHCDTHRLGTEARLKLFCDVLRAVAHAHGHLVVHRDIKPGNILVTPEGTVKLLDFGIAKLIADDGAASDPTDLTREWGRALTPEYAAREQLRGEAITTATDVYALGVLLYELLTGHLPHPGRRRRPGLPPPNADDATEPSRPSTVVADPALRRQLDGDLDTITLRAMKAAPAERYPTVAALLDDLTRHLSGHAVLARADSAAYRLRKWVLRHRAATAVAAGVALAAVGGAHAQVAVLLALAAGTLLALWQARAARAQAAAAQAARQRAEDIKQFIASIFTEATPREGAGGVVTALGLLESATERIEAELAGDPAMAGELGVLVGDSCSKLGDLTLGGRALQAAVPRCRQALGATHPTTLRGRVLQMEALNGQGLYEQSRQLAPALLTELRSQLPQQVEWLVFALEETSFALAKLQDQDGSLTPLREAVAMAEAHLGPLHEQTLSALGRLSNTCNRFGLMDEALSSVDLSLARTRQSLGGVRPHTRLTEQERWYADVLVSMGRPADAEPVARQVVADQRALDSEFTRRVVNAMASHALALSGMGRVEESVAVALAVVLRHDELSDGENEDTAANAYRLATVLMPTRRVDEIDAQLDRDERVWRQLGTEKVQAPMWRHRRRAAVQAWRGNVAATQALLAAGDAEAQAHLPAPWAGLEWARLETVRAMSLRLQGNWPAGIASARLALARGAAFGLPALGQAQAHTELGLMLIELGDLAGADEHLQRAMQLHTQAQVIPSLLTADTQLGLGRLHLQAGRLAEARQQFEFVEGCWAAGNPGSVWHAQAKEWLVRTGAP